MELLRIVASRSLLRRRPIVICKYCQKVINPDENKYRSYQAGMQGVYHWRCFVEACRRKNKDGGNHMATMDAMAGSLEGSR